MTPAVQRVMAEQSQIYDQHLHYERIDEETDVNYLLFLFDLLDEIAENVDNL
jgi:hypothetical protein